MALKSLSIIGVVILLIAAAGLLVLVGPGSTPADLTVVYPFDGAVFPPDMAAPTMKWDDAESGAALWTVSVAFSDGAETVEAETAAQQWKPRHDLWETIKERSTEEAAAVTVTGYKKILGFRKAVSRKTFTMSTSKDEVGAPIFYRMVTLPFEFAVNHMETIKWCLGDVSSDDPPRVVLENMPVCGNCHSFSQDGSLIGMDVDYANDKGSYIITGVDREMTLANDNIITWSDYRSEDGELTFGLLSRISPDGRYAISTVKDRSVFVPVDDLYYSQLFFPLKGILVYYDRETGRFLPLRGADDRRYVQSNPAWSPDGGEIVFAKSEVGSIDEDTGQVLLTPAQCEKYISRRELFKFDLYRIPFNGGKGGEAVPIPGASDNGRSNYFPKYSPDGRWLVFCQAESFMLLQPDSRLYIIPAEGGEPREMNCNTGNMNSWHSWSPNGRWLVFSSKAFTPYTQLFLTHIDENGNDSPPVLLENLTPPDRAANIPEFVNIAPGGIEKIHEKFIDYYSFANKGGQMIDEGRLEDAEIFLRRSIELKPDFAMAHKRLGMVLARMQRFDEAEEQWLTAKQLDPDDHLIYLNLGSHYLDRRQYDKARENMMTAIRLNETCAPAITGLGIIRYHEGDRDGAEKRFREAIEADPGFDDAYARLGTVQLEKDNRREAEELFRKACALNRRNAHAHLGLAKTLSLDESRVSEAIEAYRRAISLAPGNVQAHVELGNLYLKNGDRTNALNEFDEALRIDPTAQNLRNFVSRLRQKR